jgi:hypothetical protein
MLNQFFAERAPFMSIFDRFFITDSREPETLDDYTYAFVVEVCHNNCPMLVEVNMMKGRLTFESLILFTYEILDWNLDVFKSDIGRSTGPDTLTVHFPG